MLTDTEKTKIELEEKYRIEISNKLKALSKMESIENVIKVLQGLAIIIGIIATYLEFKKQNDDRNQLEISRLQQAVDKQKADSLQYFASLKADSIRNVEKDLAEKNRNEDNILLEQLRNDEKRQLEIERQEQTAKEFRKYFYQKQFDFYAEAAEATATLATETKGSDDYKDAYKKFYRLYWGRLSIVEDKTIANDMVNFRRKLEEYEKPGNADMQWDLKNLSYNLSIHASSYIINVWLEPDEIGNYESSRNNPERR